MKALVNKAQLGTLIRASLAVLLLTILLFTLNACGGSDKAEEASLEKTDNKPISDVQQEMKETFGRPKQFILTYTPVTGDDGDGLARTEVWFYPKHQKSITFVAGDAMLIDDMEDPGNEFDYPEINIEDFTIDMDLEDMEEALGADEIEEIEFMSDMFEEDEVKTYSTSNIIFTIEHGHLIYMQTLGVRE